MKFNLSINSIILDNTIQDKNNRINNELIIQSNLKVIKIYENANQLVEIAKKLTFDIKDN